MVDRNNGQLDMANRMIFPMPDLEAVFSVVQLGSAQRRCHAVQRRLRRARAVPVRSAQRQADGDHLPRHERARRALGFPEQAQGDGARSAARAGDGAAGRAAARSRRASSSRSTTACATIPTAGCCRKRCVEFAGQMRLDVRASASGHAVAVAGHRPGRDHARASARQAHPVRRGAAAGARSREGIRGQRHRHGGDEGVRARSARGVDRRRSGDDERPRGRRRRRRSAARAERRRRRSQHDGHRRGVRRARLQHLDQHVLPVLRLEGAAAHRRRPPGAASKRWPRQTAGSARGTAST